MKLLDYRDRMAELNGSKSPFAIVVKAHLKLQETRKDNSSRKVWKLRLIRQLHEAGYNQEQVVNLFNFLDWVLVLPKRLEAEFWMELKAYEEERQMPYITTGERIGYDRGKAEGAQQQARSLILRQLTRKVGSIPDLTLDRLTALSLAQLEALGEALLDFGSIADLTAWLDSVG